MERCPFCEKLKDSVCERPDGYARDVNNELGATMYCCDECAEQNALDI